MLQNILQSVDWNPESQHNPTKALGKGPRKLVDLDRVFSIPLVGFKIRRELADRVTTSKVMGSKEARGERSILSGSTAICFRCLSHQTTLHHNVIHQDQDT